MPIIYMKHDRHGLKIATMELEAEMDETNGWERYTPGTPARSEPAATVNALDGRRRRRRSTPQEMTDGYGSGSH
jgi:hypothetical protein